MNSAEIIALLNRCEAEYPVDRWAVGDVEVWPIARMRWYNLVLHHDLGSGAEGAGVRSGRGFLGTAARTLAVTARNRIFDFHKNARPGPQHQAILFSDGVSLAKVEGEWYDRFMDPIVAELAAEGRESLLLMPMAAPAVPRHTPSLAIQTRLDAAKLAYTVKARLSGAPPHNLPRFDDVVAMLRREGAVADLPGRAWLIAQAGRIMAMARQFDRLIARTGAKLAFVNTYYSADGMAFVLAARRRGCVTIDVQHGAQVDHVAYHRWRNVPADGFALLPDLFWCWSGDEVAAIREGFGLNGPHQGVVAGNLWWRVWMQPGVAVAEAMQARLAKLKQRHGASRHILVTHTWGHTDEDWLAILNAMAASSDDLVWWVRLHPMQISQRERFRKELRCAGVRRFELDAATDYPLPLLLDHMDANVTESSSTVLEAATVGVPSVITTRHGADLFGAELGAGRSRFAADSDGILAAIVDLVRSGRVIRPGAVSPADPKLLPAVLADALARAGARGCPPRTQTVSPRR